jgi:hypothetical protein
VVIAYEDAASRNSAVQLCGRVFQSFSGDLEFQADWWAFKYLDTPELGTQAVDEAADSDLLIISADSRGEFPQAIKYWFERWLSKLSSREHPDRALVSLAIARLKEDYLRGLAFRANLDYLPLGNSAPEPAMRTSDSVPQVHLAAVRDADHRYHIPDWGINE